MLLDDYGKQIGGLFGTSEQEFENLNDDYDMQEMWERGIDEYKDTYTGEALIDRELLQKELNRSML